MLLYRLLISLTFVPLMVFTWMKGSLTRARFGPATKQVKEPHLWLHAASNGELTSARPLIEALVATGALHLIITVNSASALALGRSWTLSQCTFQLAPFDLRWIIRHFVRNWSVSAYVGIEAEYWPNRFSVLNAMNAPTALVAARMSGASVGLVSRLVLERVDWIAPQDTSSQDRFIAAGVKVDRIGPVTNLKSLYKTSAHPKLSQIAPHFDPANTILAASVHVGEDQQVIDAFAKAKAKHPNLHLIIAPRHPDKIEVLTSTIVQNDLSFVQFSKGQTLRVETDVTVADTLGDMPLWYPLADLCFVGGSLVDKGGHTPFEPMGYKTALLHGPHVANFSQIYADLDRVGGARLIEGEDMLAKVFSTITPAEITGMITAQSALTSQNIDLPALVQRIISPVQDA